MDRHHIKTVHHEENYEKFQFNMSRFVFLMLLVVAYAAAQGSPECPVNSLWSICGPLCEPTCSDPHPNPLFCPRIQCTSMTSGCRCQEGYVRKSSDVCVKLEDC